MFPMRFDIRKFRLLRNSLYIWQSNKQFHGNLFTPMVEDIERNKLLKNELHNKRLKKNALLFSTEQQIPPVNPDIFGEISGNEYEKLELDEDEKEQEKFEEEESCVPRRLKLSPGGYAKLVSDHIATGDLYSAIKVLELIKNNRDKPTTYIYNLLLRGYAVQGNLKKCFKLYNDMKKRALPQNAATYTSIFNACANSMNQEMSIEILNKIRHELLQKNFPLNETHYNVMIKAYGKHKCLLEAFTLVDEMVDKRMSTGESTFNSLLFASITDESQGLRYALKVWHLMQQRRIKPSILTYNLLLRAIRDTKFGDVKLNDEFIKNSFKSRILLTDDNTSDLLAVPPVITRITINSITSMPTITSNELEENKSLTTSSEKNIGEMEVAKSPLSSSSSYDEITLDTIQEKNRLILFGGYTGFIKRMEKDNVVPDTKTLTLLMESIPPSISIENDLIRIARAQKISLDIDFFNMLIKKRSSRRDYRNAKKVLDDIQLNGLVPNVVTWGVLAFGCQTYDEASALIEGMNATGHTLNPVIATTLLNNARSRNDFNYILNIMEIMYKERVRPTEITYKVLDSFQKNISNIVLGKIKSKHSKNPRYRELFAKFNLRYDSWQRHFERNKNLTKTNK